jgi:hypothetical protein
MRWDDKLDARLSEMRRQGLNYSAMANQLGCSKAAAERRLHKLGKRERAERFAAILGHTTSEDSCLVRPVREPRPRVDERTERESLAILDTLMKAAVAEREPRIPPAPALGETVWDLVHHKKVSVSDVCRRLKIGSMEVFEILADQKRHLEAREKIRAARCGMGSDAAWQRTRALRDAGDGAEDDDEGEAEG